MGSSGGSDAGRLKELLQPGQRASISPCRYPAPLIRISPSLQSALAIYITSGVVIAAQPFLLAEQREGWSLMIFCARATRGRGLPSHGLMARLDVPAGGQVKKLRARREPACHISQCSEEEAGEGSMDTPRVIGKNNPEKAHCPQFLHARTSMPSPKWFLMRLLINTVDEI
jgi:hypothetical protein